MGFVDDVKESVKIRFPNVFSGLVKLSSPYPSKLKHGSKPFCRPSPSRISLLLEEAVKFELKTMEEQGVIFELTKPTDWCSDMVVVPKAEVRICVDYTKLSNYVCRKLHVLPTVDETLSKLSEVKVFSKLDANSGFWQIPLSDDSKDLTTFYNICGKALL